MSAGPCQSWIDGDDVATCCDVETTDGTIFDAVAEAASEILFELSGRKYAGTCERTVRPCRTRSCQWPLQVLSRGYVVAWGGWGWGWGAGYGWGDEISCGCRHLSTVKLSGFPVQSIDEVKIDGNVVDPATYRLDRQRDLVRVRDPAFPNDWLTWPSCQALDLPDTEAGTFSVTYTYGAEPPTAGLRAAEQLACELWKSCTDQPCALPKGTVRVTRQGVTIEKAGLVDWVFVPTHLSSRGSVRTSGWRTGLSLVDIFLNTYNPEGLRRRPVWWSPASRLQYPLPMGEIGGS